MSSREARRSPRSSSGETGSCERPARGKASCRSRAVDAILRDLPFRELIVGANSAVSAVGLPPAGRVTMTTDVIAGLPARCFERRSGESAARWCFSDDGVLLSLELTEEGRAPTEVEATRVSGGVDPNGFDPPASPPEA